MRSITPRVLELRHEAWPVRFRGEVARGPNAPRRLVAGGGGSLWTRRVSGAVAGQAWTRRPQAHRQRKRKWEQRRTRRNETPGLALYRDLRTREPTDLQFAQLADGTHVPRFTNTLWNDGEGRLELEAPTSADHEDADELYQNLYDATGAGKRAEYRRVYGRIIYHPQHAHYHFADFAADPLGLLTEGGGAREQNNAAVVYFAVANGALGAVRASPDGA